MSLVETVLVVGGLVSVGALAAVAYQNSASADDVRTEQQHVRQLSEGVTRAFGATGTYNGLTTALAVERADVPNAMRTTPGRLGHSWGGAVELRPATFNKAGDGFRIEYQAVPAKACARFAVAAGTIATDVIINGQSVMATRKVVDNAQAIARCGQNTSLVVFAFRSAEGEQIAAPTIPAPSPDPATPPAPPCPGCPAPPAAPSVTPLTGSTLVAVAPTAPPTSVISPTVNPQNNNVCELVESRSVPCASGQTGNRTESRSRASCAASWSGWTVVYDGCRTPVDRPIVTPPTPSGCPQCVANTTFVQNQNYNPSYPQTWTCAATPPAWATGCPSPCAAPAPQTQWVTRSDSNCPAGTTGTRTWEAEQRRTASCPAPYGPFNWSGWSDTGNTRNLDTSGCVPVSTCKVSQWGTSGGYVASVGGSCQWSPTAQYDLLIHNEQPIAYRGVNDISWVAMPATTSCPKSWWPAASAVPETECTNFSSCTPQATTQWVAASGSCPSGQTGSITWEKEQRNTSSCPSGAWSGWTDTGATRNVVNTCVNQPPAACAGGMPYSWQSLCIKYDNDSNCDGGLYEYRQTSMLPAEVRSLMSSAESGLTSTPRHEGYNVFSAQGWTHVYQKLVTSAGAVDTARNENLNYNYQGHGGPYYRTWNSGSWPACDSSRAGEYMGTAITQNYQIGSPYPSLNEYRVGAWQCACPNTPTVPVPSAPVGTITGKAPGSCTYTNTNTPPPVTLALYYSGNTSDWSFSWNRDGDPSGTGDNAALCGSASTCDVTARGNWIATARYNPTGQVTRVRFSCSTDGGATNPGGGKY